MLAGEGTTAGPAAVELVEPGKRDGGHARPRTNVRGGGVIAGWRSLDVLASLISWRSLVRIQPPQLIPRARSIREADRRVSYVILDGGFGDAWDRLSWAVSTVVVLSHA